MQSQSLRTTALRCSTAFALLAIAAGSVSAQDIAAGFPKGLYRQNGQCTDLGFGVPSRERKCAPFLGVMSKTDGKPEFMFEGPKGLIVFATTGVSESSGDKRLVVFAVSHVVDVAAGFVTQYRGKCTIETLASAQTVSCTTSTTSGAPAWQASFRGAGVWQYQRLP